MVLVTKNVLANTKGLKDIFEVNKHSKKKNMNKKKYMYEILNKKKTI